MILVVLLALSLGFVAGKRFQEEKFMYCSYQQQYYYPYAMSGFRDADGVFYAEDTVTGAQGNGPARAGETLPAEAPNIAYDLPGYAYYPQYYMPYQVMVCSYRPNHWK